MRRIVRELSRERQPAVSRRRQPVSEPRASEGQFEQKRAFDLVLTDVVMPKLGGADLVKRLRTLYPRLRVVYMSGYTDGAISKHGVLDEDAILLEKPFTAESLARTVRRALDRPAL